MKKIFLFIFALFFLAILIGGKLNNRQDFQIEGQVIAHRSEYKNNQSILKNKYSGSINIIEKYVTIFVILYIWCFYIKKECIRKYGCI